MIHALVEFTKGMIAHYGYPGIFMAVSAEQVFLPVPVADIAVAATPFLKFSLVKVLLIIAAAVFAGATIGYGLGRYLGHPALIWLFGEKSIAKGEKLIGKWGLWGIVVLGFTPAFRVVTLAAGMFRLSFPRYLLAVLFGRIPYFMISALVITAFFKTKFYASVDMSAVILGALQGFTEFLPISSSGHLALAEQFVKLPIKPEEMFTFDILLHGASLMAILAYFWKDWVKIFKDGIKLLRKKISLKETLGFKLILGTIPAIFAALAFEETLNTVLRGLPAIGIFFILTAPLYFYASWRGRKNENEAITTSRSVWMGIAQAAALIPSLSRSGATIAAGMIMGVKREIAAKFSFMLGGVAILAANVYALFSLRGGAVIPDSRFLAIGFVTAFLASLLSIAFLIKYLQKHGLNAFGFYVLLLGILILTFMS
ncbi:VTT domain-containing protein [Candidatus Peregrinibacteria bacterium]|nr:VTT domain-containing protein [Candidatus Peregrinibacteria bacterium]